MYKFVSKFSFQSTFIWHSNKRIVQWTTEVHVNASHAMGDRFAPACIPGSTRTNNPRPGVWAMNRNIRHSCQPLEISDSDYEAERAACLYYRSIVVHVRDARDTWVTLARHIQVQLVWKAQHQKCSLVLYAVEWKGRVDIWLYLEYIWFI